MNTANKICTVCLISAARKFLRSFILVMVCYATTFAQKKSANSAKLITQVPFTTFTGGVVVIRAQLVGYPDTLNFIMDTGSGGISLDSTTCIRLNITPVMTDRLIMGIGGVRQLRYVNDKSLLIGNLQIDILIFQFMNNNI